MNLSASPSAQALSALSTSLNATASNIANISTEGHQPARAELADGPGGQGVQVAAVTRAQGGLDSAGAAPPAAALGGASEGGTSAGGVGVVNGVDVTREMVGLMQTERAFSANVVMLRALEQTTGHVLNLVV
ncbi:flagellar basal body rod C-terminal domain-containing protein [Humidesulfovibrio sp.]